MTIQNKKQINKIKIHKKYLKDNNLMKMIEKESDNNKLYKYIE